MKNERSRPKEPRPKNRPVAYRNREKSKEQIAYQKGYDCGFKDGINRSLEILKEKEER